MPPSDSMILVIGPRLECHSGIFLVIQTHLSRCFYLAVDFLGLRRSGFSSQVINQGQDFVEQVSRHGNLGQLERNVPPVTDNLRAENPLGRSRKVGDDKSDAGIKFLLTTSR